MADATWFARRGLVFVLALAGVRESVSYVSRAGPAADEGDNNVVNGRSLAFRKYEKTSVMR